MKPCVNLNGFCRFFCLLSLSEGRVLCVDTQHAVHKLLQMSLWKETDETYLLSWKLYLVSKSLNRHRRFAGDLQVEQ